MFGARYFSAYFWTAYYWQATGATVPANRFQRFLVSDCIDPLTVVDRPPALVAADKAPHFTVSGEV